MAAEYNGSENEEFSRQTIQGKPKKRTSSDTSLVESDYEDFDVGEIEC